MALLALFASLERFMLRPDLLSAAFLAVFVAGSERFAARPRLWFIALPLLQVVWTNTHGLHILGPIYLGLRGVGDALDAAWERRSRGGWDPEAVRRLRQWAWLTGACSLAVLANANGLRGILYPFQLYLELRGDVSWFPRLEELRSPLERPLDPWWGPISCFWLLAASSAVAVAASWRVLRFGQLLPLIAFFYLSLEAVRNVPLFAVVAVPAVACGLQELARRLPSGGDGRPAVASLRTALAMGLVASALLVALGSDWLYRELGWVRRMGVGELPGSPEIAERLRATPGRILNDPNLGGYLIWQLYPDKQVALDGRWEVYGELFRPNRRALYRPKAFHRFVREHDVTAVVVDRNSAGVAQRTPGMLARFPSFRLTLESPDILLYERVAELGPLVTRPPEESEAVDRKEDDS